MGALAKIVAAARASAWTWVVLRAALALAGVAVLAVLGASVTAAAPARPNADARADPPPPQQHPDPAPAADAGAAAAPHPSARARASPDAPVDLNRATAEDLRRLPGCGEKRAEAILALRRRLGRFRRAEELLRVKGVGRATLRKWRPLVRIDAPDAG